MSDFRGTGLARGLSLTARRITARSRSRIHPRPYLPLCVPEASRPLLGHRAARTCGADPDAPPEVLEPAGSAEWEDVGGLYVRNEP